ncbi:MAG: response regulator transcription factor [Bacteroidota bacterium]|nr:response regulator transcription factor [Bacteroidota bacterium]
MPVIKYAIADDHEIFRQGLKLVLGSDHSLQFTVEAENGIALMQLLKQQQPHVVLLDLKMPLMDGFATAREIKKLYPAIKILILTMYDEEHFIVHMLEAGANGYLLKNANPDEIRKAIHAVHENNYYFNDLISSAMLKNLVQKNLAVPVFKSSENLTEKEIKILELICQEHTSTEIGEKVFLSARTVEGIRAGIMEKVGVRNIAGLVMYAVKKGIVK